MNQEEINKRPEVGTTTFRNTRSVCVYGDGSELLYLPDSDDYVWQRPVKNSPRPKVDETPILAENDQKAMLAVFRLANTGLFAACSR